jgi:hypothetical protein
VSEAYVIDAIEQPSGQEQYLSLLEGLLKKAGIPPRRVEEIHTIGNLGGSRSLSEMWTDPAPAHFTWPSAAGLAHFVLHACARAVENGERDVLLLAQVGENHLAALILASPAGVGRHNLVPRARLGNRWALAGPPEAAFAAINQAMMKSAGEPVEVGWVAAGPVSGEALAREALAWEVIGGVFPRASRLSLTLGQGDFSALAALIAQLEAARDRYGLLVSCAERQPILATLVERI